MYVLVVGGGKVGLNLTRELMQKGNEVTLIEADRRRYAMLEPQLEHVVQFGDGTELWVLEQVGVERADMVIAVTGDDEDNIIISQVAREKYGRESIIARCNNIRNMEHFELLGIRPVVSSTDLILRLIEHEVPQYGLVHLLTLQVENLEIIEVEASPGSPAAGTRVDELDLPEDCLVIAVLRDGGGMVPRGDMVIEPGDEVLLVLSPNIEGDITRLFDAPGDSFA
ncbi:MAG: TrkA family potassium uptake protein [Actinobacteria bacterium]|nr:TrkA family potassium uptake protein [Actinomycetota bacterium]